MTRRFTQTEKWHDVWFRKLSPEAKVLFEYLRDNCDIAGFIEIDFQRWSFDTGLPLKEEGLLENCRTPYKDIATVMQELASCCFVSDKYVWLKNFIYHQGNLPLSKVCNVSIGIIKSINSHNGLRDKALEYLHNQETEKNLTTVAEGLANPSGKGKGKGNGKGNKGVQGEMERAECFIDHTRAMGRGHTIYLKSGKQVHFYLCPKCNDVYCELFKAGKITSGKTTLAEIENKVQAARKLKERTEN